VPVQFDGEGAAAILAAAKWIDGEGAAMRRAADNGDPEDAGYRRGAADAYLHAAAAVRAMARPQPHGYCRCFGCEK